MKFFKEAKRIILFLFAPFICIPSILFLFALTGIIAGVIYSDYETLFGCSCMAIACIICWVLAAACTYAEPPYKKSKERRG